MDIPNQIIQGIEELKEPTIFEKYRIILKSSKKLKRNEWLNFRKLMKTDFIFDVLKQDLTNTEAQIVKNCIKSISIRNFTNVVKAIIEKDDANTLMLLEGILFKGKKFDLSDVKEYLNKIEIPSSLLQIIKKKYPELIN